VSAEQCAHVAADAERARAFAYLAEHADADRRLQAGEQSRPCLICRRWRWPDEVNGCPLFGVDAPLLRWYRSQEARGEPS
jgi:hypothetical protein